MLDLAPAPLTVALLAAAGYAACVVGVRRSGPPWPWVRVLSAVAALALFVLATCGPPGAGAHTSLTSYVQMLVLLALVVPIFTVWSAPVSAGRMGLPVGLARVWSAWWDSRLVVLITHPLVAPLLLLAIPVAVIATPLLRLSLEQEAVLSAVQVVAVAVGVLATLPLSDSESPDHGIPHALSAFLAFFELLLDAIPGIVLTFTTTLVAGGWYAANGVPGGSDWASADQRTAGTWLWACAELVDLPFLFLVVGRWMRADAAEARRIDAALDAEEAAARAAERGRDPDAGTLGAS